MSETPNSNDSSTPDAASAQASDAVPADPAVGEGVPSGGNAAQAAAVFGTHDEPPAEMDSGGAG
jgi:hypothetical protein